MIQFLTVRDRVTLAVLELIEKGELANLEKKWWYEKGECSQEGTPKKVISARLRLKAIM